MRSTPRQFCARKIVAFGLVASLALGRCVYKPTSADRANSFAPYEAVQIRGDSIHDFLAKRFGLLIQGTGLTFTQSSTDPALSMFSSKSGMAAFSGGGAAAIDRRGYFMTAAHCVDDGPLYLCTFEANETQCHRVRIVWRGDATHLDLAILRLPRWTGPVFQWAGVTKQGDAVLAHGADFDPGRNLISDHDCAGKILGISAQDDPFHPGTLISHSAPLYHGDSGGPLTDVEGRLIGINSHASGTEEIKNVVFRLPMIKMQQKAMRPDLDWVKKTIDEDFLRHPNG
jgi:S1-C subfamily serine protease